MNSKENKIKKLLKYIIFLLIGFIFILNIIALYSIYIPTNKTYARETYSDIENEIKISDANEIDIDKIINENTENEQIEKIIAKEETLEYLTQYKINKERPKGVSYVTQEGTNGKQQIIIKETYDSQGNIVKEEQIGTKIIKSSSKKVIEIGGANYTSNYKTKKGDEIYVTSDMLVVWAENSEYSRKITTLKQGDKLKIVQIEENWYKIKYESIEGWVKSECTVYFNIKKEPNITDTSPKTKQQILNELNFNMKLNKPSGLSLEQFKKVLSDDKDVNKIIVNNAEYFYYIEKQYNINGIFIASMGVHESAWGTSKIALNKNNLFGYGAYDSNPYNGAYSFTNYAESIDLIARVLVKYYLNPAGTSIYGGEKAIGSYYNGPTLTGVNIKYATDKNWGNAVYSYIKYFYNKL